MKTFIYIFFILLFIFYIFSFNYGILISIKISNNENIIKELIQTNNWDLWGISENPKTYSIRLPFNDLFILQQLNINSNNIIIQKTEEELKDFISFEWEHTRNIQSWNSSNLLEFFNDFHTYSDILLFCDTLLELYPSLLTKIQVGETYQGKSIYGYILSSSSSNNNNKPVIWLEALLHAREWLAPPTLIYSFYSLVTNYGIDSKVTNLIDGLDLYIIPVVNIDGYEYTWEDDKNRLWRKNMHVFDNALGVDLNRNWGPNSTWCTAGSSSNKKSDTYCGEFVFSEPETRSLALTIGQIPNLKGGIDFHTYGGLLLWPWQYTLSHVSLLNYTSFSTLGSNMVTAINNVNGMNFISQQGSDLYEHSGGFIDYNYDKHNMITFTIELRGNSFIVPPSDIILSGTEAYQGVLVYLEYILNRFT